MKFYWVIFLLPMLAQATEKSEAFIIKIQDRSMSVVTPEVKKNIFSVIVQNQSLSTQVGKFMVKDKNLKFVSIESGSSASVEIENKTAEPVVFMPISPAFQEIELLFGKKAYEIPSKE